MRNNIRKYVEYFCLSAIPILIFIVVFSLLRYDSYIKSEYFTVMIPEGIGYTVHDEKIKNVEPNGSTAFEIEIHDGYEFIDTDIGEFIPTSTHGVGTLTLNNIAHSVTVDFCVRLSSDIASVENGTVVVTSSDGSAAKYGQPADFTITPKDNYVVEEVYVNGKNFDFMRTPNGSVTVTRIYDRFVSVQAVCLGKECSITVSPSAYGKVEVNIDGEIARYGDSVRVKATPDTDYKLAYLTIDDKDLFTQDCEFTVTDNTYISATFIGKDSPILMYDYGDGTLNDKDWIEWHNDGDFIYLKNGVEQWKYDGYTLESWNTEKDGSGKRHALGAMIAMPSVDTVLYAQYKKHTPVENFEFAEYTNHNGESGYTITAFSDASNTISEVVLPDVYNGKGVYGISDEAFRGASGVNSVVTNTSIEKIGDNAFAEMPALSDLYLYDGLRELSDSALYGSNLRKLHINSAGKRIYDKILETNIVDKQMLVQTATNKKIVTLSGCSMAKGLNPELFTDDMDLKDYDIVNMGVHARYGLGFLMYMVENYLNDGDIVVFAMENYEHLWFTENSMRLINSQQPYRLRHLESNYDIYEEFDLAETRETNDILSVLPLYFRERAQDLDAGNTINPRPSRDMMNKNGYYTYFRSSMTAPRDDLELSDIMIPRTQYLSGIDVINDWAQKLMERGVKFCFIFPPTYRHSKYDSESSVRQREEFCAELADKLIFPVIGDFDDVVMPYNCFSDHIYHTSTEGTPVYTEKFGRLLSDAIARGVI